MREMVGNVMMERVREEVLDRSLKHYRLPVTGSVEEKVERLAEHVEGEIPEDHVVDCNECGAPTDDRLSDCVCCGVGGEIREPDGDAEVDDEEPAAAKNGAPVSAKKPTPAKAEKEKPVAKASKPAPAKKASAAKPTAKKGTASNGVATVSPAVSAVVEGAARVAKPRAAVNPKRSSGAVITTTGEVVKGGVESDLDRALNEYRQIKLAAALQIWELGGKLLEIYERQLYLLRTKGDKAAYSNWRQFVQAELDISVRFSYQLMDIRLLFTPHDVETVGVTKLNVMINLPEADRNKLLAQVKREGTPFERVREEVLRLAGGTGRRTTGRSKKAEAATAAAAKKAEEKRAERGQRVTVAYQLGRTTVPLFAKRPGEKTPGKRAKKVTENPVGSEPAVNGVLTHYRVVQQAAGLVLVIERVREPEAKA